MAVTRTDRTAVRLRAWGETKADVDRAVRAAGRSPSRNSWEFVDVERLESPTCPLDVRETGGDVIAADAGYGWAYVVLLAPDGR